MIKLIKELYEKGRKNIMFKYFNKEERLTRESIPTYITGPRRNSLIANPTTQKEANKEMRDYFKNRQFVLERLGSREAAVLSMYYGLNDGQQKTYREVAERFNISTERVRQLLAKAFRELRHPARMRLYTVLTDEEVGYIPPKEISYIKEDRLEDISVDTSFIEKLDILKEQKIEYIQKERYDSLSSQEKEADSIMSRLMNLDVKYFLKALNITREQVLGKNADAFELATNVQSLLKLSKKELKEKNLQILIDAVTSIGLQFEEDFEYAEDFNKASYASMINVGLDKIKSTYSEIFEEKVKNIDVAPNNDILYTSVESLGLSSRARNCLNRASIDTLGDLVMLKDSDLRQLRNLGDKSYWEIRNMVHSFGLDICPENVDPNVWIAKCKNDILDKENTSKNSENEQEMEEDYAL